MPFVRGTPWQWHGAGGAAFAGATNLLQGEMAPTPAARPGARARAFAPALWIAAAALALHVTATLGDWAWWRIEAWRAARAWTSIADRGRVPAAAASTPAPRARRSRIALRGSLACAGLAGAGRCAAAPRARGARIGGVARGRPQECDLRRRPLDARPATRGPRADPRARWASQSGRARPRSSPPRRPARGCASERRDGRPFAASRGIAAPRRAGGRRKRRTSGGSSPRFALLVVVMVGWLAVWQPLQQDLAALRAAAPAERGALAEGERMAAEIAALARADAVPPPPDAHAALERIAERTRPARRRRRRWTGGTSGRASRSTRCASTRWSRRSKSCSATRGCGSSKPRSPPASTRARCAPNWSSRAERAIVFVTP